MATGKRYYWIKLKDSFMSSDEIDYLMSQPDGANYVVLYQMLCLKTINTNGCLVSKIGEMLIPYDAEKIQRECKWFPLSTVRLALTVYKQIGLIFENPDGTLSISDYQNMIGSETDWAAKNRRIRSNAANKELQEGHDTGHTSGHNVSSDGGENVPTEKEIEKDKEIENRSPECSPAACGAADRAGRFAGYGAAASRRLPTSHPAAAYAWPAVPAAHLTPESAAGHLRSNQQLLHGCWAGG